MCLVFPQEPPSGTLPPRVCFFILPVWQLVCKQYMAVLHRVPKLYINGVPSDPQGPAPPRRILVLCVPQMCLFLPLCDHSMSGLLGRPCWQMSRTCVLVHLCLSFWKDSAFQLQKASQVPCPAGQPAALLLPPVGHGWHCPFHLSVIDRPPP